MPYIICKVDPDAEVILNVKVDKVTGVSDAKTYFEGESPTVHEENEPKTFKLPVGLGKDIVAKDQPFRCVITGNPSNPSDTPTATYKLDGVNSPTEPKTVEGDMITNNLCVFDQSFWFKQ
ncbi:hypothetical protein ES703_30838 [subsurface metagenome]|nr:hypothetical protein [bacterium]